MSEKGEARRDGAKLTPNSGRGHYKKGDAILNDKLTIDFKEYSKSFGLTKKMWSKVCTDAFRNGQTIPALKVVLGEEDKTRLWVIGDEFFHEMWELWVEKYG